LLFSTDVDGKQSKEAKERYDNEMHTGMLEDQGVFDIGNPGMGLRMT
jgi:hypothetical protein